MSRRLNRGVSIDLEHTTYEQQPSFSEPSSFPEQPLFLEHPSLPEQSNDALTDYLAESETNEDAGSAYERAPHPLVFSSERDAGSSPDRPEAFDSDIGMSYENSHTRPQGCPSEYSQNTLREKEQSDQKSRDADGAYGRLPYGRLLPFPIEYAKGSSMEHPSVSQEHFDESDRDAEPFEQSQNKNLSRRYAPNQNPSRFSSEYPSENPPEYPSAYQSEYAKGPLPVYPTERNRNANKVFERRQREQSPYERSPAYPPEYASFREQSPERSSEYPISLFSERTAEYPSEWPAEYPAGRPSERPARNSSGNTAEYTPEHASGIGRAYEQSLAERLSDILLEYKNNVFAERSAVRDRNDGRPNEYSACEHWPEAPSEYSKESLAKNLPGYFGRVDIFDEQTMDDCSQASGTQETEPPESQTESPNESIPDSDRNQPREPSAFRELGSLFLKIIVIAGIAALVFTFVYGFHYTVEPSMNPSVKDGDLVLYYRWDTNYKVRDLLLVTYRGQSQIRRVVATAGDTVNITEQGLVINGALQQEPGIYEKTERYAQGIDFPVTLREGEVFVLADARAGATDSRMYGPVKIEDTQGTVIAILRRRSL